MMWRYVLAWVPMVVIAMGNGTLRQRWYGRHLSELHAHQLSTLTGVLLFGLYMWALSRLWRLESSAQAVILGSSGWD